MVESHLARVREKRGMSAADLAQAAGISRQTVYSIENGSFTPNTAVALRLARALDASVEELFTLPAPPKPPSEEVTFLPGSDQLVPGQPVQLCRVDRRLMACGPSAMEWFLPACDGILARDLKVRSARAGRPPANRLLVAGCDPGMSVLARHVRAAGVELVLAHRNSSESIELLRDGCVHIAGSHLRDETTGESNLPRVHRIFPEDSVTVISFAIWEAGIVTARGNPKGIQTVAAFARPDITIVNRERGSGGRHLLDMSLGQLGINRMSVRGYDDEVHGHLPAAWRVHSGAADACVATRAAARALGLGFIEILRERYDLIIQRQHLELPAMQTVLDTLTRSAFRRELESYGGYEASIAGQRLL
ncbi:MAG TPA: substrate-binding domain-containing protein [Bryobacteraceae bacterium]|nr:substrate-binding domain-containing protein [Bryobacteraceae bacterium]